MTVDGLSGVSITVVGETMVSNLNVSGVRVSIFCFLESVLDCDGLGGSDGVRMSFQIPLAWKG